jgi:ribosomal protein S6--L-glutamate ligase
MQHVTANGDSVHAMPYFVSFRPEIPMEVNLPAFASAEEPEVRKTLGGAAGVLLPNYVAPWRYRAIVRQCRSWFPRLDTQFDYCGKTRQTVLFRKMQVRQAESRVFENPDALLTLVRESGIPWELPFVLKGDMGGGGSSVFPIRKGSDLLRDLQGLPADKPLLIQKWVEHGGMDLRVVVYGTRVLSYFRIGDGRFYNNICRGGRIDHGLHPDLQARGVEAVRGFCLRADIDVAGFDLMFPDSGDPVFVEINFHFGRKGLGGTKGHRKYIEEAVWEWRKRCLAGYRAESRTVHTTTEENP